MNINHTNRGRDLMPKDAGGKSDPFVTVSVGGVTKRTKVVKVKRKTEEKE